MSMTVKLVNRTRADLVINRPHGHKKGDRPRAVSAADRVTVPAGGFAFMDADDFKAAAKGNRALSGMVDDKRLVVSESAMPETVPEDEDLVINSDAQRPPELQQTADAQTDDKKVKHESKGQEAVAAPDAPKQAKGKGKAKASTPAIPGVPGTGE